MYLQYREQLEEAVSGSMLIQTLFGHEADEQTQQDMNRATGERRRVIIAMQSLAA